MFAWLLLPLRSSHASDWIELRTPHFTVMSEASESRTRSWATEFELFRRAMMLVMPVAPEAVEPVTLVLFRSDRRLRAFKPHENGKPSKVAGFFVRSPARNFIALAVEGARDDVREIVFHEGVHWHLSASERALPRWMEEGLGEVFGNFRLSGNTFVVGSVRPAYMRFVQVAKAMPFSKMAAVDVTGLNYNGKHAEITQLFYCQSWVLVHSLFFGVGGLGHHTLAQYVASPPSLEGETHDLEKGLGLPVSSFDARIADYLAKGRFRTLTMPFDRTAVEAGMKLVQPSNAEVDLVLGNLLVGVQRADDAEPYLARAHTALPGDTRTREALALMSLARERLAEAELRYRELLDAGHESYLGHFVMARAVMAAAYESTPEPSDADVERAFQHLLSSLRLNRRFLLGYETLSLFAPLIRGDVRAIAEQLELGAARYPANARIQAGLALARLKQRNRPAARAALLRAQATLATDDGITRALLVQAEEELRKP